MSNWEAPAEKPTGPTGPVALTETNITGLTPGARPRPDDPACTIDGCGHPRSHHTSAVTGPLFTCVDCDTGCIVHSALDAVFWPRGSRPL